MALKFHSELLKSLSLMLNNANDYDVIIQVRGNREFRAHSNILKARSLYFESAFSARWIVKKNNIFEFKKPNIDPAVFEMILKYIYTGEVDLTNKDGTEILELLVTSDELILDNLFKEIQDYLIKERTTWIQQNFVFVLNIVIDLTCCKELQDHCFESICKYPQPLFTSNAFTLLDKDILHRLLKRDDLQIEEILAWDCLIKWGIEQTPGLGSSNSNKVNWNSDDFEALKVTLNRFIPLIRFVDISRADFFDKVRPYKAIIPHYIYEETMKYYMKDDFPITTILHSRVSREACFNSKRKLVESQSEVPVISQSTESQPSVPSRTESQSVVPVVSQRTESQPSVPQRTESQSVVPVILQRTESIRTVPTEPQRAQRKPKRRRY